MKVLDLFSGIGGFALGCERAGMQVEAFAEIDPWCRRVLRKHWPDVPIFEDVRDVTSGTVRFRPDVVTGGFPCQDISLAGNRKGIDGERSGLWSELARVLGELRPRYAIVENVPGLLSGDRGRWFGRVLGDLAALGFDAQWDCIPASAVGAPHQRDRVWLVAYADGDGVRLFSERDQWGRWRFREAERRDAESFDDGAARDDPDADGRRRQEQRFTQHGQQPCASGREPDGLRSWGRGRGEEIPDPDGARLALGQGPQAQRTHAAPPGAGWWSAEPDVGRVVDGFRGRVDRLRGLGNAVVPQVVEVIARAVMEDQR